MMIGSKTGDIHQGTCSLQSACVSTLNDQYKVVHKAEGEYVIYMAYPDQITSLHIRSIIKVSCKKRR